MSKGIVIKGIKTNNLKGIDIVIPYQKIVALSGVSGGGKSSLAYNTIYSLCHQEFRSIESGYYEDASYDVQEFSGLIPSIAIKQVNTNINPRSTLYSYLNIYSLLSSIKDKDVFNAPFVKLKLNKPQNECNECDGLGEINNIDFSKVISSNLAIEENPINPWRDSSSNKGHSLLIAFCIDNGIDISKKLDQLTSQEENLILNGISREKYAVSYKLNGKPRKRTLNYQGIVHELKSDLSSGKKSLVTSARKYCSTITCKKCEGSRVCKTQYDSIHLSSLKFTDFLLLNFKEIHRIIIEQNIQDPALKKLTQTLESIISVGLGYLSLSRSIPSLSGGELQKLNFSKLLTSDISQILIVIDEISSQVHVSDYEKIISGLQKIRDRNNTILLVEHNSYFIKNSELVYWIGPKAGVLGGKLIEGEVTTDNKLPVNSLPDYTEFINFTNIVKHNVQGLNLAIPQNKITVLVGKSGAGKSSIAKFIKDSYKDVEYISQELIRGNVRSTVASYLEINSVIANWYAKYFKTDSDFFFPSAGKPAACSLCDGKGVVSYARSFDSSVEVTCSKCNGKLFSEDSNKFKIDGQSVIELYDSSIENIITSPNDKPNKLKTIASVATSLGLGHLSINRKTTSLSGGELKRLKLLKSLIKSSKNKVLIIDEPGAGLDDITAHNVMNFIKQKVQDVASILLIDHKPSIFLMADYLVEIGPESGIKGGKIVYKGTPHDYYYNKYLNYLGKL